MLISVEVKTARRIEGAAAILDRLEEKVIRRVRTPAGVRRYKQPIGSIIVRDGEAPLKNIRTALVDEYEKSITVTNADGSKKWHIIKAPDDGRYYALEDSTMDWDTAKSSTTQEELLRDLDHSLSMGGKPGRALNRKEQDAQEKLVFPMRSWTTEKANINAVVKKVEERLTGAQLGNVDVNGLLYDWEEDSSKPSMLVLKRRAAKKFDIDDPYQHRGKQATAAVKKRLDAMEADTGHIHDAIIDAQYEETQAYFKSKGITELTVFRGMKVGNNTSFRTSQPPKAELRKFQVWLNKRNAKAEADYEAEVADIPKGRAGFRSAQQAYQKHFGSIPDEARAFAMNELGWSQSYMDDIEQFDSWESILSDGMFGNWNYLPVMPKDVPIKMAPLSSWTTDYSTARDFGETLMSMTVPVEQVFSTGFLGMGDLNESEVIVIGSGDNVAKVTQR